MTAVLGIDGGGTRTRAVLATPDGDVVGSAIGGSVNPRHHSPDVVRDRLSDLVAAAVGASGLAVESAFLSLGGISTPADASAVEALAARVPALARARVTVENDAVAALTGGLSGRPGMVLIAGTGSACMGRSAQGERYWCGGWEFLADDAGSAYWMAVEAIRAAVRVEDGRLPASALRDLVFGRWAPGDARGLAERLSRPDLDRAAIAALAPGVIALAGTDALARTIVDRAADELALLVAVTARRLFAEGPSEVIFTGGLALSGPPFTPLLVRRIEAARGVCVVEPELPPALGAVIEAARRVSWPVSHTFVENLAAGRPSSIA